VQFPPRIKRLAKRAATRARQVSFKGKKQYAAYCFLASLFLLLYINSLIPAGRPEVSSYYTSDAEYGFYLLVVIMTVVFYTAGAVLTGMTIEERKNNETAINGNSISNTVPITDHVTRPD
jgi:hypothetical protein